MAEKASEVIGTGGVHPRDIIDKYLKWVVGFAILIVILFGIKHEVESRKSTASATVSASSAIPLASSPQSSWPKLVIPAGGRSERIPALPDMHIVMRGNNFRLHNVYKDGHECAFGESCIAGPQVGTYATNEDKEMNIIFYAYAPD